MEFTWDDISKKLSDAADFTVRKTEKFTSIAKLDYKLAATKNKLNLLYQNVGKMQYAKSLGESVADEAFETEYEKITALIRLIEKMEDELATLRNYRSCIACGGKIGNDMEYCPRCGTCQSPEKGTDESEGAPEEQESKETEE